MDEQTKTALEESIAHWKRMRDMANPNDETPSRHNCPLCTLFNRDGQEDDNCVGCPIYAVTEILWCGNTPYENATDAWYDWDFILKGIIQGDKDKARQKWQAAADAEIKFLEGLK